MIFLDSQVFFTCLMIKKGYLLFVYAISTGYKPKYTVF